MQINLEKNLMGVILIRQLLWSIEGIFKGGLAESSCPTHAAYGIGGVIVLLIIYNRLLNKYQ